MAAVDHLFDRLFSSALNPLYQSGTLAILSFAVVAVTGLYLFLFYRVGTPYESVHWIQHELPLGRWARTVHTYAADLAMAAAILHALKMFLAGRSWGPRALAWISGVMLIGITLFCGWTGQVMAWDLQGQVVATELTRVLDLLPLFSVPLGRTFAGSEPVSGAFFFMNLFLHLALPLGVATLLWVHLSRVKRPMLLPPRRLLWSVVAILAVAGFAAPLTLAPSADLLRVPEAVPTDLFYNFWLPLAWNTSPGAHAAFWVLTATAAFSVPFWWRGVRPTYAPSHVDPELCTGCTTCYQDCPFDAISMIPRPDPGRRSEFMAFVTEDRCVSCGICAGSCAPMGVGPPPLSGRDQLRAGQKGLFPSLAGSELVVFACRYNAAHAESWLTELPGVVVEATECSGNLHTSKIEMALRSGPEGVFVLSCPSRDARCREGPKWLHERVYNDREAELAPRVDKRRVRMRGLSRGERREIVGEIERFRAYLSDLGPRETDTGHALGTDCEPKRLEPTAPRSLWQRLTGGRPEATPDV